LISTPTSTAITNDHSRIFVGIKTHSLEVYGPALVVKKLCPSCRVKKPLSFFSKASKRKDGYASLCKFCKSQIDSKYCRTPNGKFKEYRSRAKFKGIDFTLTKDEFMSFWQSPCYYCGYSIHTVGIDRIDSSVGYRLENCRSCCAYCNKAKNDMSEERFLTMCRDVANRHSD
jgi:hypothetical protein